MIKDIAEYIDSKMASFVEKFLPLVQIKTDGEKTFPAFYTGRANYKPIKLDNFNGIAYLRQYADGVINETLGDKLRACKTELNILYPLRLVFAIPRTKVKTDDEFAEDGLMGDILREITIMNGGLRAALKANSVSVIPSSWSTDPRQIWNEETSGTGTIEPNYKMIYGAINLNVSINIYSDCIKNSCEEECYAN